MASDKHAAEIVYEYIEELDPNLVCAICQSALVEPVTTTSCKHTFCRDCIERAISVNPQCPIDRSALTVAGLRETEQLVKLMLDELHVKCTAEGCGDVMQRGLLLSHSKTCQKAVVTCSDGDCGLSMAAQRMAHHRAYECFKRQMACEKCDVLLTFRDGQTHHKQHASGTGDDGASSKCTLCNDTFATTAHLHKWSCPSVRVPCTHSSRGCPSIILRADLATHLSSCPFESLSGFLQTNDERLSRLESRNEALTIEIERLSGELREARLAARRERDVEVGYVDADLQAFLRGGIDTLEPTPNIVGGTLIESGSVGRTAQAVRSRAAAVIRASVPGGERARTTSSNFPSEMERERRNEQEAPEVGGIRRHSMRSGPSNTPSPSVTLSTITAAGTAERNGQATIRTSASASANANANATATAAAAATTTAPPARPPRRPPMPAFDSSRGMFSPSFGSHQTFADWTFQRLGHLNVGQGDGSGAGAGGSMDEVTPTSTTGPMSNDALVSEMRAVIIHLAAAMDSMERRHEVRTMTETLRVLEEVGSLRAIVNTMRMQVMMDRPTPSLRPNRIQQHLNSSSQSPIYQPPADNNNTGTTSATALTPAATESNRSPAIQWPSNVPAFNTVPIPDTNRHIDPDSQSVSRAESENDPELETASITESVVFTGTSMSGLSSSGYVTAPGSNRHGSPSERDRDRGGVGVGVGVTVIGTGTGAPGQNPGDEQNVVGTEGDGSINGLSVGAFSTTSIGTGAGASPAYATALRNLSQRNAARSAAVLGGAGGTVGQPTGLPAGVEDGNAAVGSGFGSGGMGVGVVSAITGGTGLPGGSERRRGRNGIRIIGSGHSRASEGDGNLGDIPARPPSRLSRAMSTGFSTIRGVRRTAVGTGTGVVFGSGSSSSTTSGQGPSPRL